MKCILTNSFVSFFFCYVETKKLNSHTKVVVLLPDSSVLQYVHAWKSEMYFQIPDFIMTGLRSQGF